ncbi:MAG: hypothetical protein KatS3mg050_0694 [Litorilinea sp.]|nr:MAG: hypothetical protein KatS3mg050_0694 [Litorilinea sp.]
MNPDALSGVTEAGRNGVETASIVAPVTEVATTPFAPDTAGAESLFAALSGGGAETAYADEIMGDVNPEEIMSNMDKILGDDSPKVSGTESPNSAIIETKIASTPISTQASEGLANPTEAETKAASTTDPALSKNTATSESEQLAAALSGTGSAAAYADEIMGRDENRKDWTQDQKDAYGKGIRKSPQITTPQDAINRPRVGGQPGEIPKVVPPSTDTAIPPVEAGAAPVSRDKVDKPVDLPASEPIDGDAGSPTIEAPKEPSTDMTEDGLDTGTPSAAPPAESSEPESTRDQLSSRIEALAYGSLIFRVVWRNRRRAWRRSR